MNKTNVLMAADYLEQNVPQKMFSMSVYREGDDNLHKCDSVGCVLGHTTILDRFENIPFRENGIFYWGWAQIFYDVTKQEWNYLFAAEWRGTDNTVKGAVKRLRYVAEHGLPETWEEELKGKAKLSYL